MTVLGEAFIEVRSDLRPFIRDLDREVRRAAQNMERQLRDALQTGLQGGSSDSGERLGEELGDGVGRGMRRRLGDSRQPPWVNISAALASALDDGISALPTKVKAGIVIGIVAALPFLSAAIAGATSAALGAGLVGIGTALAFQYTEVEEAGKNLADTLRAQLVGAAEPFVNVLLRAFSQIELRVADLRPRLDRIFANSAQLVEPLVQGLLDGFDFLITAFDNVSGKLGPFVDELADGFALIGSSIGNALEMLVNTGEEGEEGLRDLFMAMALLIEGAATLLVILTEVYGFFRDIAVEVPAIGGLFSHVLGGFEQGRLGTRDYGNATQDLGEQIQGTVSATDRQTKAIKEAAAAMDKARDAAFGLIDATLDYEQSIDDLAETLKENGKAFTAETEKGRENIRALGDAIKAAQTDAETRYAQGKLSAEEANALYRQEVDEILRVAKAHGISEQAIRGVYDEALRLVNLPAPDTGWLTQIANGADLTREALERALRAAQRLNSGGGGVGGGKGPGGFTEFGDGGLVQIPTKAIVGDGGSEVVIPLTRPARAAELMRMSGLDRMLQPAAPSVTVFVGNEQLDARTYRIVTENNNALSSSLAFGARGL
jgi:hypothetical protein